MIAKMALCATVMLLAPAAEDEQKPAEVKQPQSVEKSKDIEKSQNDEKPKNGEESTSGLEPREDGLLPIQVNIVKYTNAARARYGLPALEIDKDLVKSAEKHCSWMTRNRRMVHTRMPVAENIAMGQRDSQMVLRAWMNSSGHRANILNGGYRRIGVAAYRTPSGTIYWCQQFQR